MAQRTSIPGLVLQHGPDGPPAIFGDWLEARGIEHEIRHIATQGPPSAGDRFGWIASLGSEHTPGTAGAPGWVDDEVTYLRDSLRRGLPVLGLCFGGQALALAAGGSVGPSRPPEIGWIEIETTAPELVPGGPWLHYHYDLLAPPPEADVIATSPAGPAAFRLGASLGVQFHPEATAEIAIRWAALDAERLTELGLEPELAAPETERSRAAAMQLFDAWWALCTP